MLKNSSKNGWICPHPGGASFMLNLMSTFPWESLSFINQLMEVSTATRVCPCQSHSIVWWTFCVQRSVLQDENSRQVSLQSVTLSVSVTELGKKPWDCYTDESFLLFLLALWLDVSPVINTDDRGKLFSEITVKCEGYYGWPLPSWQLGPTQLFRQVQRPLRGLHWPPLWHSHLSEQSGPNRFTPQSDVNSKINIWLNDWRKSQIPRNLVDGSPISHRDPIFPGAHRHLPLTGSHGVSPSQSHLWTQLDPNFPCSHSETYTYSMKNGNPL